ncbi:uncharacterized protein DEA37_0008976 [Paragonimus westermani]|uniref:Uncharacterized protein n=1 Tax=Paragonimus westermani TaxID=34504 RepID=A0A5J4P4C0_9TREM|nr:uncharacterized protein DEA37_0008976 [Paragonimus westermani]
MSLEKKIEYKMIHIASFGLDLQEKMNANKVLQQLNSRPRRSTMTEKFGPVRLTVVPSALVLDRSVWWPESSDTRLPYKDLNEVYTFVKETKKICFDIVSSENAERRVLWFKMKNPLDVMKLLELIQKYKMAAAMYEKDNVRPVQYGNWVSTYCPVVDDNDDDDVNQPDRNVQSPCSTIISEHLSTNPLRSLPRTPFINEHGLQTLSRRSCSNINREPSYKLSTVDAEAQMEIGSLVAGNNPPMNTIQIIFQGLDPSMLLQNAPVVRTNTPAASQQRTAVPDGMKREYVVGSSNGTMGDLVHSNDTCPSPVDAGGMDNQRKASHYVSLLKQNVSNRGLEKGGGRLSLKFYKNEKHSKSTSDLYGQRYGPYSSDNIPSNSQTVKYAVPTTEPFYLTPRRSVSNLRQMKPLSYSTGNTTHRRTLGYEPTEDDRQQDTYNHVSEVNSASTSETKFFKLKPLRIAQLDSSGSRFAFVSTTNVKI